METAETTLTLSERLVQPLDPSQRAFRVALVAALLLHAALFIEVGRSVPRAMGDRQGAPDAIAVDLVTEADLKSRETVAMPPAGVQAPPPAAAPQPPPEPQPEPQTEEAAQPQPKAVEPAKEPPPPDKAPEKAPDKPQEQAALPDFESALQDLATAPFPNEPAKTPEKEKPAEAKPEAKPAQPAEKQTPPTPAKKKPAPQARLDPSQQDLQNAPPGRSAGATRPPGITRSGENDDFGRAVVRALRQTMPPPRGIFGRVTVRLILTENGDLAEVRVLDASGTSLDQSVVFATKQTYYPLPPYKSTVADRTFTITYVYR